MRGNQSKNTELNQAQQINKSIELIYQFLVSLNKFADVEYYSLAGNHDRTCGDKSQNESGDNANVIISEQLHKYNILAQNKRLKVINSEHSDREIIIEINGLTCKFIHGDEKIKESKSLMQSEISMDEEFYNILFRGHWHNFSITSENKGRYVVNTGCLSGFNDYSSNFGCASNANQTICIIGDSEIELIKGVDLQIN
jgi:predicted phosphodiesterase